MRIWNWSVNELYIIYIYICVCVCVPDIFQQLLFEWFISLKFFQNPDLLWHFFEIKIAFLVFCVYMDRSFRDKWNIKYETYVLQEYSAWDFDEHSLCIFIETQKHPRPHSHTYCEA